VTRIDWQQISGLKSCILVRIRAVPELLFQDGGNKFSSDCWTHDIEKLVKLAGLEAERNQDMASNVTLEVNWRIVIRWNEKSRYQMKTHAEALELYNAIADNNNGVMQWIRARW
jgi:hypothetical protein